MTQTDATTAFAPVQVSARKLLHQPGKARRGRARVTWRNRHLAQGAQGRARWDPGRPVSDSVRGGWPQASGWGPWWRVATVQWANQSNQSTSHTISQSANQFINQSKWLNQITKSINQINQPVIQSFNQSTRQSINQSTNQLNQSVDGAAVCLLSYHSPRYCCTDSCLICGSAERSFYLFLLGLCCRKHIRSTGYIFFQRVRETWLEFFLGHAITLFCQGCCSVLCCALGASWSGKHFCCTVCARGVFSIGKKQTKKNNKKTEESGWWSDYSSTYKGACDLLLIFWVHTSIFLIYIWVSYYS